MQMNGDDHAIMSTSVPPYTNGRLASAIRGPSTEGMHMVTYDIMCYTYLQV